MLSTFLILVAIGQCLGKNFVAVQPLPLSQARQNMWEPSAASGTLLEFGPGSAAFSPQHIAGVHQPVQAHSVILSSQSNWIGPCLYFPNALKQSASFLLLKPPFPP